MIRFKITVRMTDNTTEITIEARQPMRETRTLKPSVSSNGAALRGRRHRSLCEQLIIRPVGPAHRAAVLSAEIQAS